MRIKVLLSESSTPSAIGGVSYPNKLRSEDKMALLGTLRHIDGSESHKYVLPMGYLTIENVGDDFEAKYQPKGGTGKYISIPTLRALLADFDFDPRDSRKIYKSFLGKYPADTINKILGGSRGRPWGQSAQLASKSALTNGTSIQFVQNYYKRNSRIVTKQAYAVCAILALACDAYGAELSDISIEMGTKNLLGFDVILPDGRTIEIDKDGASYTKAGRSNIEFSDLMDGTATRLSVIKRLRQL